jgi:nucleoside-diphosphate-sugar epimerase
MKLFVTGGTGFVGRYLVRHLCNAEHEVVALVRDPSRAGELSRIGARLARGDVTDKESMRAPMTGVDGIFHVAGWYKVGVRDKSPGRVVNIEGTRNVLELMRELRISKGVYTSTLAVNSDTHGQVVDESYRFRGRHLSEYDRTKDAAHDLAESFAKEGLPLVIAQPGMIYGPDDQGPSHELWVNYLTRRLPMMPRGLAFCWAHVDDVARAHVLAMEKGRPGESYFTCGPIHTLIEGLRIAERITGVPAPRFAAPPGLFRAASRLMSVIEKILPVPDEYSAEYLRVNAGTTYIGSNAKARRELGWTPRPLEEGLPETLRAEMQALGMA